jgi:PAS domain S-box-containing protein
MQKMGAGAMQDAKSSRTIEKKDKLRARKPKLEHVSHDIHVGEKPQDNLKNLYRSIMENTYIGITLIGLDYKILMVNNMIRRYSHKPVDELVGRECFREFEKRDSICPHCPGKKAIITGQPAEAETAAVHDDGSRFPVRIQAFPAMKSDGTVAGFIEIIEDITEHKKAEQALRESENNYRELADSIKDVFFAMDSDLRYTYWNKASEALTGIKEEDAIGKTIFEIFPNDESTSRSIAVYQDVLKTRRPKSFVNEYKLRGKDFYFEINAYPTQSGISVFVKDITERKRAEEMILKERDKAQKYLDIAAVMLLAIDAEQKVRLINKKGCEILGYSEDEIIGKNWFDNFLPKKIRDDAKGIFNKVLKRQVNGSEYHENPVLTKNGKERLIAWHNTVLRDDNNEVIATLSSGDDITERRRVEEALRHEHNLLRQLIDNLPYLIYVKDCKSRFILVNDAVVKNEGFKCEQELLGKTDFDLYPEEIAASLYEREQQIIQKDLPMINEEGLYTDKQGNEQWFLITKVPLRDENGKIVGLVGINRNISERKQAEKALRESEERYRLLVEQSMIGIGVSKGNKVEFANSALLSIFGYDTLEEFAKIPLLDHVAPSSREMIASLMRKVNQGETPQADFEYDIIRKDGKIRTLNAHTFHLTSGDAIYTQTTFEDVTERKQAEQKLLDYQSQLKSLASQLTLAEERERRRIAIEMHDRISQSLAIVKVKLDGLRYSIPTTNPTKTLEEVCNLLGQAITDVRSLTFDLSSPILNELGLEAAVAAWLTEEIEQKHNIIVELEDDKKHKPLDNDIGAILFRNVRELLINVVKHSHATKVKVTINSIGNMIRIGVEDNGVGFIPAEVTSKAVRKGGFGLFSIRERLEQLGGRLEIKSAPGCGCKVEMMAPLKKES